MGYTYGRREIPGFPNWFADASCRIWSIKSKRAPDEWPYTTIETPLGDVFLDAAEVTALCFLGEEGCNEVYSNLAIIPGLRPNRPECKEIATSHGISAWAVFAASLQPVNNFVVIRFAELMRRGIFNETMRLHDGGGKVEKYDFYEVENRPGLFDHVIKMGSTVYRTRRFDRMHVAKLGDWIRFRYRRDYQGGLYLIPSTITQIDLEAGK